MGGRWSRPRPPAPAADWLISEYGTGPSLPFVRETYDAMIALAAEAASSTDGEAIHDELVRIACPPGDTYVADAAGVKAALEVAISAGLDGLTGSVPFRRASVYGCSTASAPAAVKPSSC